MGCSCSGRNKSLSSLQIVTDISLDKEATVVTKYVFVTGGVVSGLGKGITAASLGRLLKSRGLKVAAQ